MMEFGKKNLTIKNSINMLKKQFYLQDHYNKNKGIEKDIGIIRINADYKFFIASLEDYKNNSIPKIFREKHFLAWKIKS